ncbi:hypothetical protein JH06_1199 [Blastocystis sp. subtype 4]|uniref:hypothetical protein n=1 Tax=Blastocystis sp. subtype 4 TaxID=944170 RepID=UPI0007118392|nr:hypothetical protein JH06_1199 [Blastocystis sp. subtype 4]KNB45227.1 hypothetical protein JH06_1199 [Blastocystis sp. subtype 4]|eukprot:XP_014528670.1 hypothetical protein JH06_1199 [Blastocystis sp. subtype 4]
MEEYAKMILEWSEKGYASEIDLFVTRPILWLAEKKNLRDANLLFTAVKTLKKNDQEFGKLPLIHFCDFLLQTLMRDAAPLFNLLKEKYDSELRRDPELSKMVTEIAKVYFNIYSKNDMFSNMLKMFAGM